MHKSKKIKENSIIKVEGNPISPGKPEEKNLWERFKNWLSKRLVSTDDLIDAYTIGEKTGRNAKAYKNIEEAAEFAAKADLIRQKATKQFFDNVDDIFGDNKSSPQVTKLKLAKLSENNPDLEKQLEKVNKIIKNLAKNNGFAIQIMDDSKSLPENTE